MHILLHPGPFLFVPLSGVMHFQWTFLPEMHVVVDVWEYPVSTKGPSRRCLSTSFSNPFNRKEVRLIGQNALAVV